LEWTLDGANRNDIDAATHCRRRRQSTGLVKEIAELHLDRRYDHPKVRRQLIDQEITEFDIRKRPSSSNGVGLVPTPRTALSRCPVRRHLSNIEPSTRGTLSIFTGSKKL